MACTPMTMVKLLDSRTTVMMEEKMMTLIWKEGPSHIMGGKYATCIARTADGGQYTIKPQPKGFNFSPGTGLANDGDPFEFAGYRVEWSSKHYRSQICEPPVPLPDHRSICTNLIKTLEEAKAVADRDYKQHEGSGRPLQHVSASNRRHARTKSQPDH